ncbi:hypothetical protein BAUCODRAFT_216276 [Baudoinia panamericana UAMH 10762]|uniref:Fork-head domain-containing protein n=1 Tax=Baudoinia panamericana (strain UAMH 10762) TaxID=717646 RepID=M2LIG2_BAUPA|nr:uncharacterized protein BAUCODRAFT_216276 [Baudoinia panamericana UAMH 10762]EMC93957.1 hypothetical protein BAUCODRAFT_216276 [Baudoinia panamericana UAMH 10762]
MSFFNSHRQKGVASEQKPDTNVENYDLGLNGEDAQGVDRDVLDMRKMGVRQETKRRFGLVTILGFTTTMMCTWESAIPFFTTAFINGGGVSMIYGYIFAFFGALATCASMAEMASMYPISGGQYHWTALLAPPKHAKFLSWLTGWLSTLGWQAAASTGTYLGGVIIQALVSLNYPSYEPQRWQGTLILFAVLIVTLFVNTVLIKLLPGLEGVVLILHVIGFFAVLIPVVYLAPISPNAFVWSEFTNLSGYSSSGLSWLIGQSASAVLFIGYDGACHMAEEVENASINVPRAMFFTIFINGALGFATYIFILYCFGDPEDVLTNYPMPFIGIFYNALQSKAGTTALTSLLIAMYIFATFGFVASASRQAWAFSRDHGLPLSKVFRRVDARWAIPVWTIALTGVINALLGLINIGSSVAFNAIVSLVVSSYLSSYLIPIVLMIMKRLRGERVQLGPWTLGRWGLPINIIAAAYTLMTVIFTFFPVALPVTKETMNYSCVVYGGVVILGLIYYVTIGHKTYIGPKIDINIRD